MEKWIDCYVFHTQNDKIGHGAYGEVFRALNDRDQQYYVLKQIPKSRVISNKKQEESFMCEITIMSKLSSPNIVKFIDFRETQNNIYIIQEWCDQGDLAKYNNLHQRYLKKNGVQKEEKAKSIMVDILTGFQELIKHGVIHRDLKPANILIKTDIFNNEQFKLADFGFSKLVDNFAKQQFNSFVGTPLYMSPQILENQKYTTKSDIWSFGFIFYEILFGKHPWSAQTIPQLVQNIKNTPLTFPKVAGQEISFETKDLISKCLAIQEQDRIDWFEIYQHKLFNNYFHQDQQMLRTICESKEQFIATKLRQTIELEGIDLGAIFNNPQQQTELDFGEMHEIFLLIDNGISKFETEQIFKRIDTDGNQKIDLNEFRNWLHKNDIKTHAQQQPKPAFQKLVSRERYSDPAPVLEPIDIMYPIQQLVNSIHYYNLNLLDLFQRYNLQKDGQLTLLEYIEMIKKVDSTIQIKAVIESFKQHFDIAQRGYITYDEFKSVIEQTSLEITF